MKRTNVLAFWLGLAVTLAVVGVYWLGGFTRWERLSIDFRFQAVPRVAPPMTEEIVHIDIDDTAFNALGRWPWDRAKLADVVDELNAAGAKTIALDLLLSDPQQYPEGSSRTIDHDLLFADALGKARCVLAVDVKTQLDFERVWQGSRGQTEFDALLAVLGENIEIRADLAAERAGLTGTRKTYFREHAGSLRRLAACRVYIDSDDPPNSPEAFERLVAPEKGEAQGDYPERQILVSVLEQAEAWADVQPHLLAADAPGPVEEAVRLGFDTAPLHMFAAKAGAFGFVNASTQTHSDGVVREMTMRMPAPGGTALQFGLTAAMLHLGLDPRDITLTDSSVALGDVELPLRESKLWLAWPAMSPRGTWFDGLGQHDENTRADRRMSIAVPALIAKTRRVHESNVEKLVSVTRKIVFEGRRRSLWLEMGDPLGEDSRRIARDDISWLDLTGEEDDQTRAEIRQSIQQDESLGSEDRARLLLAFDNAVRWLEIAGMLGDRDPGSLEELTRVEFARLTAFFVERDRFGAGLPGAFEEYVDEAGAEAGTILEHALPPEANQAARDHRANCELWGKLREAVDVGVVALRNRSAELAARVDGKLAFVGWTATGAAADFVSTAQGARTPGVNVHAVIAHMAMTGNAVEFVPASVEPVFVLVLGLLCTLAAVRFSTLPSAMVAGVVIVAYVGIGGVAMFAMRDYVVPLVAPIVAGALSWVAVTALQAALVQRDRQRIERQFKARVSAQLVDHLVTNPDAITVTGEEREMTTVFADLAGFTTVAETLGGAATVSTLNRYMTRLTDVLIDQGAYVNKFLGDGVMAFWSAFALDNEQATRGCIAALRCQQAVREVNEQPGFENIPRISMRVGVATGNVVVGDCGAPPALNDYTVIGDAVNLAARLESANKQFGTGILINGRTQELLDKEVPFRLRNLGRIIVVGQNVPVPVFEVLPLDAPDDLIEITERAVKAYASGEFEECLAALKDLESKHGEKKLVAIYREAIDVVGDDFDGALRLVSK